jgi:hypothetical protein
LSASVAGEVCARTTVTLHRLIDGIEQVALHSGRLRGSVFRWKQRRLPDGRARGCIFSFTGSGGGLDAYSARSRTPFRCDGGQHSTVMADTVPR